jgi:hypothetical protein
VVKRLSGVKPQVGERKVQQQSVQSGNEPNVNTEHRGVLSQVAWQSARVLALLPPP